MTHLWKLVGGLFLLLAPGNVFLLACIILVLLLLLPAHMRELLSLPHASIDAALLAQACQLALFAAEAAVAAPRTQTRLHAQDLHHSHLASSCSSWLFCRSSSCISLSGSCALLGRASSWLLRCCSSSCCCLRCSSSCCCLRCSCC